MVIEISSSSEISDVTVSQSCPIKEEIKSPEVQQLEYEPELSSLARPRKQVVPAAGSAPVPPPGSDPVQNPPVARTKPVVPLREVGKSSRK